METDRSILYRIQYMLLKLILSWNAVHTVNYLAGVASWLQALSSVTSLRGRFEVWWHTETENLTYASWTNTQSKYLSVTGTSSHPIFTVHCYRYCMCLWASLLNMTSRPGHPCVSVTVQIWSVSRQISDRLSRTISVRGNSESPCTNTKTQQQDTCYRLSTHRAVLHHGHKVNKQPRKSGCGCKTQAHWGQICVDKRPRGERYQHSDSPVLRIWLGLECC